MKLLKIITISITSSLLVACGGGSSTPATPVTPPPVVTPPATTSTTTTTSDTHDKNAVFETTAQLIVAKSFAMVQEYKLAVSYSNKDNRSAYLSVCSDFSEVQSRISVDYNSCLVRTSVDNQYNGVLSVANDKMRLVMAIWYLDDINNPRFEIWENDDPASALKTFTVN